MIHIATTFPFVEEIRGSLCRSNSFTRPRAPVILGFIVNIKTPPLSPKNVNVFAALYKAQLPDTLNTIRQSIPEWAAVHVILEQAGAKRGPTKEEIRDELLAGLKPVGMLFDPIYTLTTPEIPANTIATYVPDRVKPSFAPEYAGWKYIYYKEARDLLGELLDRALGGTPAGSMGVADALIKGPVKGPAVLEGWSGSIGIPAYKRTLEAVVDLEGPVMFWDSSFGFETTGDQFLKMSDFVLGMFGAKDERLYFDAANFSWFVVINMGGQLRVGLLQ